MKKITHVVTTLSGNYFTHTLTEAVNLALDAAGQTRGKLSDKKWLSIISDGGTGFDNTDIQTLEDWAVFTAYGEVPADLNKPFFEEERNV